jgi:hypothetical protein
MAYQAPQEEDAMRLARLQEAAEAQMRRTLSDPGGRPAKRQKGAGDDGSSLKAVSRKDYESTNLLMEGRSITGFLITCNFRR